MNNNIQQHEKSVDELRVQWAGGRDIWPLVPISSTTTTDNNGNGFISIKTRVKDPTTTNTNNDDALPNNNNNNTNTASWPAIVRESTLFGFGAYNPRGQNLPLEINERQHALLRTDIETALAHYPKSVVVFWEGASIWEDDSSEKGFILAFREQQDIGLELSVDLARKYDQGAIYQFRLEDGERLMRHTVPVLDKGSEASVEVEIDN